MVSKRSNIIKEATEFYRELYSSDVPSYIKQDILVDMHENEPIPEIMLSEIEFAINSQKNDKTPGEDKITNEVLKTMSDALQRPLQILFNNILFKRETPMQWSKSITILLHKKGDREDLNNYRPISLMTNIYKLFSKIILNRLTKILDESQPREQAGFRKGFSTIDHIHVLTQIIEKTREYGKTLYMCFIDFRKAFDSIEHKAIWEALLQQGVGLKYVELLYSIYSKSCATIKLDTEGEEFAIKKGVRQGDPLSPKMFSAVLENIFQEITWDNKGFKVDGEYLNHLRFADDIVILAENRTQLQDMIMDVTSESKKVGLYLNATKTKILTNGKKENIEVDNEKIEYVEEYIYLGQSISFQDNTEKEIDRRIATTWRKYWNYKEIMKNKEVDIGIKQKLYDVAILPCLTYGCQTWALRKQDENKLAVHQRKMERSMLGVKLTDKIPNKSIRRKTKVCDVVKKVRSLKWKWAGHVHRMNTEKWTRKVSEWIPRDAKRKRGRPNKRWEDIFKERCGPHWTRLARNRDDWRKLGEAYAAEATSVDEH